MNLQEIFDHLSNGELSQISIGKQDAGVINSLNMEKVISNINLALTALHTRFNLREGRMIVHLNPNKTLYELTNDKVGRGLANTETKYLEQDKIFQLKSTLIKVLRVLNDSGKELALNDLSDPFSIKTPRYNLLEIPEAMARKWPNLPEYLKTPTLDVRYRANHEKLGKWENGSFAAAEGLELEDMARVEVDIPEPFLEPLLLWVASRFHNPIGMSNEFLAGNSYYAKYEAACQRLENEGVAVDEISNATFRSQGWA